MIGKKTHNKSGFTLVEIIAVLFVISLGLIGVLSLIIQNIQGQNINKNSIVAYQLAQEGIEMIRKVRDTNWNDSLEFNHSLAAGVYYMSYSDSVPLFLANPSNGDLYKDNNDFYVHGGGVVKTNFRRTIEITDTSPHSIIVHSRVSWIEHTRTYNYDLDAALFDWYKPTNP
jgi:prepilin-type N-terminal cleavage/methylation domain-containing protein